MDDFLTRLYEQEQTKTAGADMHLYLKGLPIEELEKLAVHGPAHPELPNSAQGSELDAKQKAVSDNVNKEHLSQVPKRKDGSDPTVNFEGQAKVPTENEDEALRASGKSKKASADESIQFADQVGRMMAKHAMEGAGDMEGDEEKEESDKPDKKVDEKVTDKATEKAKEKAKYAMRAINASRGAPEHIKQAAAILVGRQISEID